jgi:hypothetical protein
MSGRPKKSCDKCSAQKVNQQFFGRLGVDAFQLRCSGQRPSCQRCLRLHRPYVYSRNLRTQGSSVRVSFSPAISEKTYLGIPSALIGPLVETYFSHAYNTSLLLHRIAFTDALAAKAVRPDILLSVCAFAAKTFVEAP